MRILIISPKFHPIIGGGETFVLNSIQQLHAAHQTVAIAVEPHPERKLSDYPYPVYEIPGLSDAHLDILAAPNGLYSLIKKYRPDIIHVHGYFGLLATRLANSDVPIIVSVHSTPVWGQRIVGGMDGFEQEYIFAEQILRFTMPRLMTGANDVYTDAAQKLAPSGVEVREFPYPIVDAFYQSHERAVYRNKFKLAPSDVLITVPSRIIERKGIREAVEALQFLPAHYYLCLPSAQQPLDVDYWETIQASLAYQKVKARIIVPKDEILHDEMPRLYAASDIVAMPSYYEGAPVATVEAMAMRCPFVGADAQGINGFIRNHENGLLVPIRAVKELAIAIEELASDPYARRRYTERAAQDVARLAWNTQLPLLLELYRTVVNDQQDKNGMHASS